jgi:hypothetical protein
VLRKTLVSELLGCQIEGIEDLYLRML